MGGMLCFGKYTVDEAELRKASYKCDPSLCKGDVCCAVFDIAVTVEEKERINRLLSELIEYCSWLEGCSDAFIVTPCEIFIKKRENDLCFFNWQDEEGCCWCALHTYALKKGLNPFKVKPLNCSFWPFLRDGDDNLELDCKTPAPCIKLNSNKTENDPELLAMLHSIAEYDEK